MVGFSKFVFSSPMQWCQILGSGLEEQNICFSFQASGCEREKEKGERAWSYFLVAQMFIKRLHWKEKP